MCYIWLRYGIHNANSGSVPFVSAASGVAGRSKRLSFCLGHSPACIWSSLGCSGIQFSFELYPGLKHRDLFWPCSHGSASIVNAYPSRLLPRWILTPPSRRRLSPLLSLPLPSHSRSKPPSVQSISGCQCSWVLFLARLWLCNFQFQQFVEPSLDQCPCFGAGVTQ